MTRSTNMEHVEVLRELRDTGDVSDWRAMESALDAAIAALSAPQPPAEAQAVAWLGANPRTGVPVMAVRTPAPSVMRDFAMRPLYANPPPSAPVGVEGRYHPCTHILIDGLKRLEGGSDVLEEWDRARVKVDTALAQQPAAEAQPCGCGEATCTVPWEPGCGLGKSEQHAEAQEQGGGEAELRRMVARLAAHVRPTCGELWAEAERLLNRTAPPSAPVGVEAVLRDALQGLIDFIEIDNLPMDADAMFIAKRALAQQPAAVDGDSAEALRFLLTRIGSWTNARWDQHLRHEFGDERAERMIAALAVQQGGGTDE